MNKAIVFDMDGTLYPSLKEDTVEMFKAMVAKGEEETHIQENKQILSILKSEGYHLFLASNTTNDFGNYAMNELGIQIYFDQTFFYKKENKNADTNKAIELKKTLTHLKSNYTKLFMVGNDYEKDIKPAEELDIESFQVNYEEEITLGMCFEKMKQSHV